MSGLLVIFLAVFFLPLLWMWTLCRKVYELFASPSLELVSRMVFFDLPVLLAILGYYVAFSDGMDALNAYLTRRWEQHVSKRWPWADTVLMVVLVALMLGMPFLFISELREKCNTNCHDKVYAVLAWVCATASRFFRELEFYFQYQRVLPTSETLDQVSKCLWGSLDPGNVQASS